MNPDYTLEHKESKGGVESMIIPLVFNNIPVNMYDLERCKVV